MSSDIDIAAYCRKLRLSNMALRVAERSREAVEGKLTFPEFLSLVLQDEVLSRENKKFALRIKKGGFSGEKTIENFNFDFNPKINRAQILELASCRFIHEKVCVLIAGPCGTGKSHLAQALGHQAMRQGFDVVLATQSKLMQNLQAAKATNSYNKKFNFLAKIPLLIIDDFGLKPLRSPQDEDFHELIDERYEKTSTIVTSNLAFNEWGDAFPNRLLSAATLDRLRHAAYRVILEGESYRGRRQDKTQNKSAFKEMEEAENG